MSLRAPVIQTELILIQQIFTEHLNYARFYSMHIRYIKSKQTEIPGVYILSGQTNNTHNKVTHCRVQWKVKYAME